MRITHDSKFLDGVNYQLHYGFDFGEHPTIPGLGLHHDTRMDEVKRDFAGLADNGVHAIRMNVFTDGRSGILYDSRGRVTGLQDEVTQGVANVLHAAEDSHIAVSLVMLDHKFAERAEWIDSTKPELGTKQGHGRLLLTDAGREELMDFMFKPFLRQLGLLAPSSLLSFELINEPESFIGGLSTDPFMQMHLPPADVDRFKAFMRAFRDLARRETNAQFTVGSLALKYAGMWLDVLDPALDYLSVHYYGLNDEPPYQTLYKDDARTHPLRTVKGLQKAIPLVWGEYAANGSAGFVHPGVPQGFTSASEFLEDALNNGVKGAYAWALRSGLGGWGDCFGPVPLHQHRRFTALNAARVEFVGALPPAPPISELA